MTDYYWTINIDWDGDQAFDSVNEAEHCIGIETDRGFSELFEVTGEGYDEFIPTPMVGTATLIFDNSTKRYSVWGTTDVSLGFDVAPGKMVQILVRDGVSSTDNVYVFCGFTKTIKENYDERTVTIECVDGIEWLQEHNCSIDLNISTTDPYDDVEIGNEILTDSGYPFSSAFPDISRAAWFPFYGAEGRAFTKIMQLSRSLNYFFSIGKDGLPRLDPFVAIPSSSTGTTGYNADVFLKNSVDVSLPWENIKTQVYRDLYERRKSTAGSVLWTQDQNVTQMEDPSLEIWVPYTFTARPVYGGSIITPVAGTDFIAWTNNDGTGTNCTSDVSIAVVNFTERAKMTITNTGATAATIYLTTLQLRGTPYVEYSRRVTSTNTDYLGLGYKTLHTTELIYWYQADVGYIGNVRSYPGLTFNNLGYPHTTKTVSLQIETRAEQFEQDVGEPLYFNISDPDITPKTWSDTPGEEDDYNVFVLYRIRHKWLNRNGKSVLTTWDVRHGLVQNAPTIF